MAGFFDKVDQAAYKAPKKEARKWRVEVEGRKGVQSPIDDWVGKLTGKDCSGNEWKKEDNLNDKGQLKRIGNVFFETEDGWMCSVQYGTKRLFQGAVPHIKNEQDAIEGAIQIHGEAGKGIYDSLIEEKKSEMDKERKKK